MAGISLNKVAIEIDGKTYEFYKANLGFQRRLVEAQSNLDKLVDEIAKKYDVDYDEVTTSDKVSGRDKLELSKVGLGMIDIIASLFVNPEEAVILDSFSDNNVTELIEALK